jgi:hypothetical protein
MVVVKGVSTAAAWFNELAHSSRRRQAKSPALQWPSYVTRIHDGDAKLTVMQAFRSECSSSLALPGGATSMWAWRLTTILPAMTLPKAIDTTCLPRVAGYIGGARLLYHPIAPHPQTISRSDATLASYSSQCLDMLMDVQVYTRPPPA